ncbi:MAG: metalloregulator ArsR/SmtB family transcription factor [Pseudomonadota bacterium]
MDAIFKALGDVTRRHILDRLRARDGQTLTELEADLGMTRFGVMKHLKVLEEAGLVTTRKVGRFKHHYLNAAPIQEVVDRWIEPLVQAPAARALLDMKSRLEGENAVPNLDAVPGPDEKPDFVMETFIRATPEAVWEALTTSAPMTRYHFARAGFEGRVAAGEPYALVTPDGQTMLSGKILAAEPHTLLAMTFIPAWSGPDAKPSRNVYELARVGETVKLTVLHYDLAETETGIREGWARVISSLKTYLETGRGLDMDAEAA